MTGGQDHDRTRTHISQGTGSISTHRSIPGEAFHEGLRLDEIERQLKEELQEAGLAFLEGFVDACGDGDQGAAVSGEGAVLTRSETPQSRRYLSIFGELRIARYVYSSGSKKAIAYAPLDAKLGLPAGEISYVLEDFQQRLCVQTPYGKSTEDLKAILGTGVVVGTAEHMTQEMGEFAEAYRLSALTDEGTPPPENEGRVPGGGGRRQGSGHAEDAGRKSAGRKAGSECRKAGPGGGRVRRRLAGAPEESAPERSADRRKSGRGCSWKRSTSRREAEATAAAAGFGSPPNQEEEFAERRSRVPQGRNQEKPKADGVCGGGVHDCPFCADAGTDSE